MKQKNQNGEKEYDGKRSGVNAQSLKGENVRAYTTEIFREESARNSRFEGQVAVVTGAASGLGLAIARKLLKEGAIVALIDINEAALNKQYKEHKLKGRKFALDITQESS